MEIQYETVDVIALFLIALSGIVLVNSWNDFVVILVLTFSIVIFTKRHTLKKIEKNQHKKV